MQRLYLVIAAGIAIMLTTFITTNSISPNMKASGQIVAKTSESPTTSLSSNSSINSSKNMTDNFLYPDVTVRLKTSFHLELTSEDSPKVITDWYRQKLTKLGYSTTNFITTSTNNNIENKLQVADPQKITVKISKNAQDQLADIMISF